MASSSIQTITLLPSGATSVRPAAPYEARLAKAKMICAWPAGTSRQLICVGAAHSAMAWRAAVWSLAEKGRKLGSGSLAAKA